MIGGDAAEPNGVQPLSFAPIISREFNLSTIRKRRRQAVNISAESGHAAPSTIAA